jgi:hypothetical protein
MTMSTSQLSIKTLFTTKPSQSQTATNLSLLIGFCSVVLSNIASANDYMVEVLIFENINASTATESHAYETPQKMRSESQAWLIEPSMLIDDAVVLEESPDYLLKQHYSWGIESLPYEQSANYTIVEVESQGYIKVYAGQLLFTNIDIDYKGFRMKENRRLKLNEKHFFDHPKFGLLMQVSRLPESPIDIEAEQTDLGQIDIEETEQ